MPDMLFPSDLAGIAAMGAEGAHMLMLLIIKQTKPELDKKPCEVGWDLQNRRRTVGWADISFAVS